MTNTRSAYDLFCRLFVLFYSWFAPILTTERLKARTERERAKAKELRKVLEAKRELAKARAENIRLRKEIGGVSERTVDVEQGGRQGKEQEAVKPKPKRL